MNCQRRLVFDTQQLAWLVSQGMRRPHMVLTSLSFVMIFNMGFMSVHVMQ